MLRRDDSTALLATVVGEMVAGGEMSASRARSNVASKLENRTLLLSNRPPKKQRGGGGAGASRRVGRKRMGDGGVAPTLSHRKRKKAALSRSQSRAKAPAMGNADDGGGEGEGEGSRPNEEETRDRAWGLGQG